MDIAKKVLKKNSPNGKLQVYLPKRDFIDHITHTDPIHGVVVVDPSYVGRSKVFVQITATFCYGRSDFSVMGLDFKKELYTDNQQIYPQLKNANITRLQERLIKKLGQNACPFYFELPDHAPASVTLQPAPSDTGKPCGVEYELKAYIADRQEEKTRKEDSVNLIIRKLMCAPEEQAPQPRVEFIKASRLGSGKLTIEATLDKEKYYHGEAVVVNLTVDNCTSRTIKKVNISIVQQSDIVLFNQSSYACTVNDMQSIDGFPILGYQSGFCKSYSLNPIIPDSNGKRGLALDGIVKRENINLASSTISKKKVKFQGLSDLSLYADVGIVVHYKVVIKLVLGMCSSDLVLELPFTLTHKRPQGQSHLHQLVSNVPESQSSEYQKKETFDNDLDFIFEDFPKLRY